MPDLLCEHIMDKKTCKTCQDKKPLSAFPQCRGRNGSLYYRGTCKQCRSKAHVQYIKNNPEQKEKKRLYDNQWRKDNPEKVKQFKEKQKTNNDNYYKQQRDDLTDRYIINRLGLKVSDDIPYALIEAKRLQIQIQRHLKENGHEQYCRFKGRFS